MSSTQDQSHFTVEDDGSTTDAADLVNSGVGHAPKRSEDPVGSADDVDRTTGIAPAVRATTDEGPSTAPSRTEDAVPQEPSADRPAAGMDADPGHVFDQTNGVIEGLDGDSDGSAESEELDGEPVAEGSPFVEDAGVYGDSATEEAGRTGD